MSTQKQIDANRRNAAKSTGPRTAEGKAASRLNALKHGVYADSPVIPGENQALFDDLAHAYFDRFQPATPEEHTLVTSLIRNAWLLDRLSRIETDHWELRFDDLAEFDDDKPHHLARAADFLYTQLKQLQRRIDSASRAFRLDLELLNKLQAARTQPNPEPPSRQAVTRPNGFVPASGATPPAKPSKSPKVPPPDTACISPKFPISTARK